MSLGEVRSGGLGWLVIASGALVTLLALPGFSAQLRSALAEFHGHGLDERLTNVQPDAVSWLREQRGGYWGRYGWYLKAGESGELRIKLPANEISVLKLRLWAYSPGTLSAEIRGE